MVMGWPVSRAFKDLPSAAFDSFSWLANSSAVGGGLLTVKKVTSYALGSLRVQSRPTVWWCLYLLLLLVGVSSVLSAIALARATCRYVSKASVIWSTISLPTVALGVLAPLAVFMMT